MRMITILGSVPFALALSACSPQVRAENDVSLTQIQQEHYDRLRDRCLRQVDAQMAAREAEIRAHGNVPGYVLGDQTISRQQYRENEFVVCMVRYGPLDPVLAPIFRSEASRQPA